MRKKYKIGLIIIGLLLVITTGIGLLKYFLPEKKEEENTANVISDIKEYNYTLDDRDTKYMKETFQELKDILSKEEIDYDEYATSLAKLFVIDFYTLNNKINKYDVGGLEYIYSSSKENFKLKAMDTLYKGIIDNSNKNRIQELPEVTNVSTNDIEHENILLNNEEHESIKITCNISYRKDLGYDKEGDIYFIKNDKKLEIVKYTPHNSLEEE